MERSAPLVPNLPIPNAVKPPRPSTTPAVKPAPVSISPAPALSSRMLASTSISEPALVTYAPSPAPAATSTARGAALAFNPSFIDCLLTSALAAVSAASLVKPDLIPAFAVSKNSFLHQT